MRERTLVDIGFLGEQPRGRGQRGWRGLPYLASGESLYVEVGPELQLGDHDPLLATFVKEVRALPPGLLDGNRLGFQIKDADRERLEAKFRPDQGDRGDA